MTPFGRVCKDEKGCRLNGPANRDLAHLQETIKTGNKSVTPLIGQICLDPSTQGPKPVTLPGFADTTNPSILNSFRYDA